MTERPAIELTLFDVKTPSFFQPPPLPGYITSAHIFRSRAPPPLPTPPHTRHHSPTVRFLNDWVRGCGSLRTPTLQYVSWINESEVCGSLHFAKKPRHLTLNEWTRGVARFTLRKNHAIRHWMNEPEVWLASLCGKNCAIQHNHFPDGNFMLSEWMN